VANHQKEPSSPGKRKKLDEQKVQAAAEMIKRHYESLKNKAER